MSEWIEWNGGFPPVSRGTEVHIRDRGGYESVFAYRLHPHEWAHRGHRDDVVAYRLPRPHPQKDKP